MTGAAIFLIVFLVILLLVGLGVGIYFIIRYEKNKNSPTGGSGSSGSSGSFGTSGSSGMSGMSGNSGMTGVTGATGINGFFGISPANRLTEYLTFDNSSTPLRVKTVTTPTFGWSNPQTFKGIDQPVIANYPLTLTAPENLLNLYNSPVNLTNSFSISNGGVNFTGPALLNNNVTGSNTSIIKTWTYNNSTQQWCGYGATVLGNLIPYCLYYNSPNNITIEYPLNNNLNPNNFKWVNRFNT